MCSEPPTRISVGEASKLGFYIKAIDEWPSCTYLTIRVPDRHPIIPKLDKAYVEALVFKDGEAIFSSPLRVSKELIGETIVNEAFVCLPKSKEIFIDVNYEVDWDKFCEGKDSCEVSSTCHLNWRIQGVGELIKGS